jgi:hypothetical protein
MIPTPRVRKPPPSPIRSVSGLLHKGKGKARKAPMSLPLIKTPDTKTALKPD